jgi:hypothetical protein
MSYGFKVRALYGPKLDKAREKQIDAVLEKYGVIALWTPVKPGSFPIVFVELDWISGEDGTDTDLEISVPAKEYHGRGDPLMRAESLAAELELCGMKTSVEVWPGLPQEAA